MKKLTAILMAIMMMAALVSAAVAEDEETFDVDPAGLKFDSDWALNDALVLIYQEEEGYRISIDMPDGLGGGAIWEYSCLYSSELDQLLSVSSTKYTYTLDEMLEPVYAAEPEYDYFAEQEAAFAIDGNGCLRWLDPVENAGDGLAFINIGRFSGTWVGENVKAEFTWDPDHFAYGVWLTRFSGETAYTDFLMLGEYDAAAARLTAMGTATTFVLNETTGEFEAQPEDGKNYEAVFAVQADGTLVLEAETSIALEYEF